MWAGSDLAWVGAEHWSSVMVGVWVPQKRCLFLVLLLAVELTCMWKFMVSKPNSPPFWTVHACHLPVLLGAPAVSFWGRECSSSDTVSSYYRERIEEALLQIHPKHGSPTPFFPVWSASSQLEWLSWESCLVSALKSWSNRPTVVANIGKTGHDKIRLAFV